jgi:transposase-like protein
LTDLLKEGAQRLLHQAIEAELSEMLSKYSDYKDISGRHQIVRNGYLPKREIQTGIGDVAVQVPRVRDRSGQGIGFQSLLVPPYLRRSKSIEELLPYLYMKGISSGDFTDALKALLGSDAPGLSAATIIRLKAVWQDDYEKWCERDLSRKRYVYFWADGIYLEARNDEKQCILVIIGADELGKKELVAIYDGYRESTQSWRELLLDLKKRGLPYSPQMVTGDGAMGLWAALREVFPDTKEQRCWVHKTANLLNHFPQKMHPQVKKHIHDIWMAENEKEADKACGYFIDCYQDKYPKAAASLEKDRQKMLTFYQFPASHWASIRSTNVIESVFATVRHRTYKTKGCMSRNTALTMTFKLIMAAQRNWIGLKNAHQCAQIIQGVKFKDGLEIEKNINDITNINVNQNQQNYAA